MPPLVRDLISWLRFYLILPIPPIAGESEAEAASRAEPTAPAALQAIPLAGAVVGALGGIVLVLAAYAQLPVFVVAVLALGFLALVTGASGESGFADACRRLGEYFCPRAGNGRLANASVVALAFVILLRVGTIEYLTISGAIKAALALVAASAVARSVVVLIRAFVHEEPEGAGPAAPGESANAQFLGIIALAIAAATILPTYGVGAAISAVVLALVIAAIAENLGRRVGAGEERNFDNGVEFVAETAFLFALLVVARIS
jgi:adenosylcobinamide-GDP ribazoletransferase